MPEKRPSNIPALKEDARVLVLNQNWLGDVLFSTPAIRALRRRFPRGRIACLAPGRVKDALVRNPHLDEVLVYDERAALLTLFEPLRVWAMLRKRRFDAVFLFHRSRSKAFLAWLAGVPVRVGYAREGRDWLLTHPVRPSDRTEHKTDAFLKLLDAAGIAPDSRRPDLVPTEEDRRSAARLLADAGVRPGEPYAVVHAGGNWDLKRWPAGHFRLWIRLFAAETGWKTVLCGSAAESELTRSVLEGLPATAAVSLCGRTSVGELAALIGGAKMLLSNDSGPIHVAAAQGTRILGLYGPTSPRETGPVSDGPVRVLWKDVGCRVPCYYRSCDWRACMELLSPEEVLERAKELLAL